MTLIVHNWVNFQIIMVSERSQLKKKSHYHVLLKYISRKCKVTYSDRKQISDCLGTGWGEGKKEPEEEITEGREETGGWEMEMVTRWAAGMVSWVYVCLLSPFSCVCSTPLSRGFSHGESVQFSHSVVSDSLQPHGLQHARLPCPSPTPGVYSNSCPSSQ